MERIKIPLVDLKREYIYLKTKIERQIKQCFKTHHWILGEKLKEFEEKIKKYLKVKYAVGVASGTDALLLSLRALALKIKKEEFFSQEDEIITTPLTFIATAEAIIRSGATSVFVDIDEDTFNISPQAIKKAISKNTKGIVVVHLYGQACKMDSILKIAKEYNLFVIEDCAQSFGAQFKGKKLGTWGNAGAFSFFPSKNLGAYGDAGMIVTDDLKLAQLITYLRNHGQKKRYKAFYIGYNSRLDNLQAAVLLAKLNYIDEFNKKRIEIAKIYNQALKEIEEIKLPQIPDEEFRHVFHLYTLCIKKRRDKLLKFLKNKGIEARIYYPQLIPFMKAFSSLSKTKDISSALKIKRKILSLPLHPFLKEKEIKYIISQVKKFFSVYSRSV